MSTLSNTVVPETTNVDVPVSVDSFEATNVCTTPAVTDGNAEAQVSIESPTTVNKSPTPAATKMQAAENAKIGLAKAKQFLSDNADKEPGIVKAAERSVKKAKLAYATALKAIERPTLLVEFWTVIASDDTKEVISKETKSIIIATSAYSMSVTKVGIELGKDLIKDVQYEQDNPSYLVNAEIFYNAEEALTDLNGNPIPKGTPNVYVPVDMAGDYWKWDTHHQSNIDAIVREGSPLVIKNVRVKEFQDLQAFAKYRGVNTVLSRGMNGLEKAGNAALATQDEFYKRVFKVSKEMKSKASTITKYYNQGKTLNGATWNGAVVGYTDASFTYDLTVGDRIIETLHAAGFEDKFLKERYMIDVITSLSRHKPDGTETPIGLEGVLETIQSLKKETVALITSISQDKTNEIYSKLQITYLENHGLIKKVA